MSELISRQAAIDVAVQSLVDWDGMFRQEANCRIRDAINELPSADRPKGHWEIYVISPFDGEGCRCSECGTEGAPYWDYCPNCGAKMVREDGEA